MNDEPISTLTYKDNKNKLHFFKTTSLSASAKTMQLSSEQLLVKNVYEIDSSDILTTS
jgi:hypothetical protein